MTELGPAEIQAIIPHRWPILLVDRVVELEAGSRAVGFKQVGEGDIFLQGHFPGRPIMPAVLIVEALAQVGAVALMSDPDNRGKLGLFLGIDGFRFRRLVVPGDTLRLEVALGRMRGNFGKGTGRAEVDGHLVAEGEITFMLADPQSMEGLE